MLGYRGRDDARVVALCDVDPENTAAKSKQWQLPDAAIFEDYRQMCESGLVDLVEIIVPHHLHYEIAAFAIGRDLHVSLQKPMSLDLADADRLISAASDTSRVVRLYENFLFYPPVLKALELIEQGVIGKPLSLRLKSNAGYSPNAWDIPFPALLWRHTPEECGGGPLVFDDGHHKFSLAWIVLGQPSEVHAWIGSTFVLSFELDSPSLVSMRYESGAVASLEVVYSQDLLIQGTEHYAQDDRMEVTGTKGVIWVNRGHGQIGDVPTVVSYTDGRIETYECPTGWEQSFIGATRSLLDTIASGREPILTLAEGRDVLAAALAAQQSAKDGSVVLVPDPVGRSPQSVRAELVQSAPAGADAAGGGA
ncbi:MAG: Gfo/Idh/MocA family oxidoreductase [Acidimicrobiia bacterium]|nr:Gfo/Idh/MocA family oxidoreductase [Acidimicrobiia bacterium]